MRGFIKNAMMTSAVAVSLMTTPLSAANPEEVATFFTEMSECKSLSEKDKDNILKFATTLPDEKWVVYQKLVGQLMKLWGWEYAHILPKLNILPQKKWSHPEFYNLYFSLIPEDSFSDDTPVYAQTLIEVLGKVPTEFYSDADFLSGLATDEIAMLTSLKKIPEDGYELLKTLPLASMSDTEKERVIHTFAKTPVDAYAKLQEKHPLLRLIQDMPPAIQARIIENTLNLSEAQALALPVVLLCKIGTPAPTEEKYRDLCREPNLANKNINAVKDWVHTTLYSEYVGFETVRALASIDRAWYIPSPHVPLHLPILEAMQMYVSKHGTPFSQALPLLKKVLAEIAEEDLKPTDLPTMKAALFSTEESPTAAAVSGTKRPAAAPSGDEPPPSPKRLRSGSSSESSDEE